MQPDIRSTCQYHPCSPSNDRLRSANILLVTIKALANEIAKNLVLAGIGSLTIVDHEPVSGRDLCSQFFISEEDIGKNVSAKQQLQE